jgi:hypothetical protein
MKCEAALQKAKLQVVLIAKRNKKRAEQYLAPHKIVRHFPKIVWSGRVARSSPHMHDLRSPLKHLCPLPICGEEAYECNEDLPSDLFSKLRQNPIDTATIRYPRPWLPTQAKLVLA